MNIILIVLCSLLNMVKTGYEHHDYLNSNLGIYIEQQQEALEMEDSLSKTETINSINQNIILASNVDLSDARITCIGDSITQGVCGAVDEYGLGISYVNRFYDNFGCNYRNYGIGGSTIGIYGYEPFVTRMYNIPNDSDIIIVFGGVNDYMTGTDTYGDSVDEEGSYRNAVKTMMEYLTSEYSGSDIFFVTIYKVDFSLNYNNYPLAAYMKVQTDLASEYGINVIDIYNSGFLNGNDADTKSKYFADDVHLNSEGYKILGDYISAELIKYYREQESK